MEELTFEQLQARQSGKLAPRATASPDDEELTFDQLQAKAAAATSDPSYANTDLKYAAERYLPEAAANAVEGWYNRSAARSAGGWMMEKLVSLTSEGKKAVDELDRPKAEKNDESFMETVASTLGYMANNKLHTLSEMGKDLAANPELLGIGSFGTVRGAARLADMAKLGRAGRVAATIGGSAAEGAVLMGLWDTALQLKNDEMDWKRTGVAAATGAIMAPVMHGAVTGLKKLYDLWKNGKPVEAPPTPEEPLPPHPGDIDFDRPLTAAEADARTKKGTVKRNGQPYKSMREVPPGELASVIKGLDSEAESLVARIKEAEAKATAERAKAAKALSERIRAAEPGENGMPTPETQALQDQLRALTEPDKNGTPSPEIQALHDKLRSINEYRDGILNNDPASPLAREVVYGQEFGKFPEGDTFDRADVTPTDAVDVSQFIAERDAKPLEDRVRTARQEQVANRFRTKEGDAEQAWQEHKAAQAKAAELEALRTEYADLEESFTRRPLPGQKRASYPKLVAALAATGVTLSAFSNMTPEERQQAFAGAAFAVGAIKAKGGNWHPKATERLAKPLIESLTNVDRVALSTPEKQAEILANKTHADRMVKNWLQKYAGTESDPLKDIEVPYLDRTIPIEKLTDAMIYHETADLYQKQPGRHKEARETRAMFKDYRPDELIYDLDVLNFPEGGTYGEGLGAGRALHTLKSWLSHVGDYLKQNVKPEDLGKYDLVRAAKETAARDEKVRQEALKDWTRPNPGRIASSSALPEVKSYAPTREGARDFSFNKPGSVQMKNTVKLPAEEVTYSWREIKLPEELTPEQAKSIRTQEPSEPGESYYYTALDANGKPIVNNFTEELAVAPTPQEAYLAGQLAQEGNALGHCVGGYAEDVAAGQSRILSLRDHLGRSYATVEIQPTTPRSPVSTFYDQASPDFLDRHPLPEGARYQSDLSREWVEFKYDISHTPEYKAWLKTFPENIAQIKGAGNGAPPEYVRPYIHDLVKSGNWAEVNDLELAGLTKTPDGKYVTPDGVEPALGVPPRNPQAGRIDPDLAIRLGLTATGVAIGGYLAGDGKLSEIAFGSVGVLGMMADKGKIPKGSAAREFKIDLAKMAEPGHKSRYRLVEMPISDFLKLAKQDSTDQVKAQRVSDIRKTGEKFDTVPYLYFDVDGRVAKVTGHEGRHRARQLADEGYTTIPVEVRGPIRWSEQLDPNKFDYRETWPEKLVAESGNAELPFPVSREKAASAWTPEEAFAGAKSQQGFITSDQAVKLGAIVSGAAVGGYLAGDEKLAGMALGAVGGLAATRLPGLGRSLGKAISPQQAFGSAMRISAALGAGYYLGGKVDHPIEGAVIASGLLIGRRFLKPAIAREGDALVNARNGNLAVWEWIRHNTKRDLTETVPDEARRTAIYEALQVGARGRLAPNEQKVFDVVTDLNAVTGRDAVDAGVLKSLRQNYVTSVVEREVVGTPNTKAELVRKIMGMAFREDTGPSTRFARARKYDTLQELEAALRGTGLKVKTTDVAEVLDIYLKSMRKAVEDRVLINAVKQTQASDGTPYIAKRDKYGRFPEGYKQIDHPQLGDKAVHPELYDSLKIVFESSQPDVVTAGLLGASMAIKRSQVFGSLFHAKSLGEVYVLAMGSDMLPRPGDLKRPKRIIDEALNKFRTQGLGGEIEGLIKAGIKFGIPDDVSTTIISDLGALADSATGVKLGSKMAEKIDYVNKHLDKATWDYMQTGVKASVALKEIENLIRNNAELHALDPKKYRLKSKEEIYQEVATFSNDIAGGLDWFRIATQAKTELGRSIALNFASPQGRRLAQIIAFAPDWLMSSMRAGFKSFGESDAGFRGLIKPNNAVDLYRRYALRSAAIWLTLLNLTQYALTRTPIWDNKDPTRLQFPDGTSLQAAKHSMEVPHAVADPVGFALNKLGYFPSLGADIAQYYAGGGHMKQSQDSPVVYAAKKAAPFMASPLLDHNLSAGERVGRSVSGVMGMPLYGYNQEQRLAARRSRLEKLQSRKQNQ